MFRSLSASAFVLLLPSKILPTLIQGSKFPVKSTPLPASGIAPSLALKWHASSAAGRSPKEWIDGGRYCKVRGFSALLL